MGERITITAPSEQVDTWRSEAGEKQGNLSKYVTQMVESGRKEMGLAETFEEEANNTTKTAKGLPPGVPNLERYILKQLDTEESLTAQDIVEQINTQLEREVEEILNNLVREGRARIQDGGFVKQ